ncbi:DMT family transporter [Tsukamurella soli]
MRLSPVVAVPLILLWAFGYPLGALGVAAMSPMLLVFLRFGLSGIAMAVVVRATGRRWPCGAALRHAVVAGLLGQAGQFMGLYLGLTAGVPPAVAALVIAVNPVVTTLAARITLAEKLTGRKVVAAALGLAAVVAACWSAVGHLTHAGAGIGFTLLGLAGLVSGGLYQQRFCRGADPITLNAVGLMSSALPAGIAAIATGLAVPHPVRAVEVLAAMVVLSSLVATTLYVRAIAQAGAVAAASVFAVIPSVTALMTYAMFGTRPSLGAVVGLVLGAAACVVTSGVGGHGARRVIRRAALRATGQGPVRSGA